MKPSQGKTRKIEWGGPSVPTVELDSQDIDSMDVYSESGAMSFLSSETMGDEAIKIKAINLAISMSKLFSNVSVENIIDIAKKLAAYIKYNK